MTDASTTGAVERLAQHYDERVAMHEELANGVLGSLRQERGKETRDFHKATADTLRGLVAERDAAIQRAQTAEAAHLSLCEAVGVTATALAHLDVPTALTARLDAEWNAAYLAGFMASGEGWNGEYPFSDHGKRPDNQDHWLDDRDEARALRRAAPTEGEAQSLDDTTRAVLDRAERIVAGQSQQEQRTAEIFLRPTEGEA